MRINPDIDDDELKSLPDEIQLKYKLAVLMVIGATFGFFIKILFL